MIGKKYRLDKSTIAADLVDGKRTAITIEDGEIVEVLPGFAKSDRMVEVKWQEHTVTMFTVDLQARGIEITDRHAAGA